MSPKINWPKPEPERLRTPIGEAWIQDGVLWHRLDSGIAISEKDALDTISSLADIVGDDRYPAVVDMRGAAFADSKSRSRFAHDIGFEQATALIVDSKVSKALGNLYMRLARPNRPTKMFNSEGPASQWAQDHRT